MQDGGNDSEVKYKMTEVEETEIKEWGCPSSVKEALPRKIKAAVGVALDECFLEIVGTPDAQRDKGVYKEIRKRICAQMRVWIDEVIDDAIGKAIER